MAKTFYFLVRSMDGESNNLLITIRLMAAPPADLGAGLLIEEGTGDGPIAVPLPLPEDEITRIKPLGISLGELFLQVFTSEETSEGTRSCQVLYAYSINSEQLQERVDFCDTSAKPQWGNHHLVNDSLYVTVSGESSVMPAVIRNVHEPTGLDVLELEATEGNAVLFRAVGDGLFLVTISYLEGDQPGAPWLTINTAHFYALDAATKVGEGLAVTRLRTLFSSVLGSAPIADRLIFDLNLGGGEKSHWRTDLTREGTGLSSFSSKASATYRIPGKPR